METVLLHKSAFLYVTSIFRLSSFVFANALLTGITKTFVPFYSSFPEIFRIFAMLNDTQPYIIVMDTLLKETVDLTVNSRYPGMAPEGRRQIEEVLIRKEVEKGEILLKEGQISHNLVFVGKGMLRQFYYKNGKDVTEHFSYEGCIIICIESTLKKEPTHLMIEALEDSIVYLLPYDKLMLLTEVSWEINMFYRKILEYSLITSQIKADSWRFETARERYNLLMQHQPEVIKRAPLSHIASYLLMTPETLSRVRSGIL